MRTRPLNPHPLPGPEPGPGSHRLNLDPVPVPIATRFHPPTRFEVEIRPAPFRAWMETELDRLKHRLTLDWLGRNPDPVRNAVIRQAANEATSMVWTTAHPLLLLPELMAEKVRAALAHQTRQETIRHKSRDLMARAA